MLLRYRAVMVAHRSAWRQMAAGAWAGFANGVVTARLGYPLAAGHDPRRHAPDLGQDNHRPRPGLHWQPLATVDGLHECDRTKQGRQPDRMGRVTWVAPGFQRLEIPLLTWPAGTCRAGGGSWPGR